MIEKQFVSKTLGRVKLKKFLDKILDKAGLVDIELIKTPLVTRIILYVTRPGFAIGKGGKNIRVLSEALKKEYGIDNPQIEIEPVKDARLNAKVVADKIKNMIESGQNWRNVAFKAARDLQTANAQGFEILMAGALGGKGQRKRKHRIVEGYMKKVGEQISMVDHAQVHSFTKIGVIGIKVSIIKPNIIFPDKVNIVEKIKKKMENETIKDIKEAQEIEKAKEEIIQAVEKSKDEEKKTEEPKKEDKPKIEKKPKKAKPVKKSEEKKSVKEKKEEDKK